MDHLAPPPDLPANAREILRLWSVKDDVRTLLHASQWPEWDPYQLGAVAADFVHARERKHLDPWQLNEDSDNLRLGLTNGLSRAHLRHDPQRYDDWGCPFKTCFMTLGAAKDLVLAKDFPELFERVNDDETAIVYSPSLREFGIASQRVTFRTRGKRPSREYASELEDLRAARDALRTEHEKIARVGRSFGGRMCAFLAAVEPPDALALLGHPISPPDRARASCRSRRTSPSPCST